MLELLPLDEQQELAHCEAVIERGLETFFEVGQAMAIIRDRKLYRADFKTFEEYCRDRWGIANKLIAASEVVTNLQMGTMVPKTERQPRPLTALDPDIQREAWSEVVQEAQASGKPITTVKVRYLMAEHFAEFTNSQAKRDLRMNKVRAKVSGGFRESKHVQEFMRIRSLLGTEKKQVICTLQTLESVFTQGNLDYMQLIHPD